MVDETVRNSHLFMDLQLICAASTSAACNPAIKTRCQSYEPAEYEARTPGTSDADRTDRGRLSPELKVHFVLRLDVNISLQ